MFMMFKILVGFPASFILRFKSAAAAAMGMPKFKKLYAVGFVNKLTVFEFVGAVAP